MMVSKRVPLLFDSTQVVYGTWKGAGRDHERPCGKVSNVLSYDMIIIIIV